MSTFLLVSVALMSPPSTGEAVADDPSKVAAEAPALSPKVGAAGEPEDPWSRLTACYSGM